MKHPLMVKQWYDYFEPESVLDLGCGRGCYLYFWKWFEYNCEGIELSEWAAKNAFVQGIKIGDISVKTNYRDHDLITAIDVLEHLDDTTLTMTLDNMAEFGKRFIFSIPFDKDDELNIPADPNLYNDSTRNKLNSRPGLEPMLLYKEVKQLINSILNNNESVNNYITLKVLRGNEDKKVIQVRLKDKLIGNLSLEDSTKDIRLKNVYNLVKVGGGTITCNYVDVYHSIATPAFGTWYGGTGSVSHQSTGTSGTGWNFPRYWVGGSGNWDGSTTTHWSATTGGATGASVPTAYDDVYFNANGNEPTDAAYTC